MAQEGMDGLDSVESVLDELCKDRRSGDTRRVGIEEAVDVRGIGETGEA